MATAVKKAVKRTRPAKRPRPAASAGLEMKPFFLVNGKYVFWFEPDPEGGFSVSCQNVPGVNAEGDTFEEALADAMKCVVFVETCLAEIAAEPSRPRGRGDSLRVRGRKQS